MSTEHNIQGSSWPLVQVGRVVLYNNRHILNGKIATIIEIIDHKRVLVDGPSADEKLCSPRQAVALSSLTLTNFTLDLPRGIREGALKAAWEKHEVDAKFKKTSLYASATRREKRKLLGDFDRFKLMRLQKQRSSQIKKTLHKIQATA